MHSIEETFALALRLHQSGNLAQADYLYRQILLANPQHADAHHLLGVLAFQAGNYEQAAFSIRHALTLNPAAAAYHYNLGNALERLGQLDEAIGCFHRALERKLVYPEAHLNLGNALKRHGKLDEAMDSFHEALKANPNFAQAHNNVGIVYRDQGRLDEAVASFQQALRINPHYADAHNNLVQVLQQRAGLHNNQGNVFLQQGRLDEAAACFRQALAINPDLAGAYSNLAEVQRLRGQLDEAAASCRRALSIDPDLAEAHNNLGNVLMDQGCVDEAEASFRQALRSHPSYAPAHSNLGSALREQGRLDEAEASLRQALRIDPTLADAHLNLATALMDQGRLGEAADCCRQAARIKPDFADAHLNLGNALAELGRFDEAATAYRQAVQLQADNQAALGGLVHELQHLCLWENLEDVSLRLIEVVEGDFARHIANPVSPYTFLTLPTPTSAQQQYHLARQWVKRQTRSAPSGGLQKPSAKQPGADSRITLGYLSSDFHAHAIAYLVAELLEKHDRDRFRVVGYSLGSDDRSAIRERLVKACDNFVDLRTVSFAHAAQRIAADGVDILVDLNGYTRHARTQILAQRPAPIQVNYLGYPGTMGASFMDYILVDDFVVPPDQQPFFAEKLVHLPGCYQVNDSRREISGHTPARSACGLPAEGSVFACFNNTFKITPAVFAVWMDVLKAVPGSVLWLLEANPFAAANLRREAQAQGVAAERLVFAPRMPLADHLARHRLADLFLDTFPYNAHTTASDALWAGCPVLTLAGQTFASRVAGSLLHSLGLDELITASLEQYQQMALRLPQDTVLLGELRARLAAQRDESGLFDGGRFARNVEKAYVAMWESYTSGGDVK